MNRVTPERINQIRRLLVSMPGGAAKEVLNEFVDDCERDFQELHAELDAEMEDIFKGVI